MRSHGKFHGGGRRPPLVLTTPCPSIPPQRKTQPHLHQSQNKGRCPKVLCHWSGISGLSPCPGSSALFPAAIWCSAAVPRLPLGACVQSPHCWLRIEKPGAGKHVQSAEICVKGKKYYVAGRRIKCLLKNKQESNSCGSLSGTGLGESKASYLPEF